MAFSKWMQFRMSFDDEITPELLKTINKYHDLYINELLAKQIQPVAYGIESGIKGSGRKVAETLRDSAAGHGCEHCGNGTRKACAHQACACRLCPLS